MVHQHRFLRSSHSIALTGERPQPVLRRLQLLYHHGFLERPRAQLDYYHHTGSRPMVYGLGNKGAELLQNELGLRIHELDWNEKNRSVGRIYLEHALLVSDMMVSLELACRESGRIRLIPRDQLSLPGKIDPRQTSVRWRVKINPNLQLGIIPDRVFALEYQNPAGNLDRAFFFLEADRGTMPVIRRNLSQTSMYRKLLAYEATWAQAVHEKQFGFHRFRVLTVTTSQDRVRSLIEACSQLKSGHGLFLFTDRASLQKPRDIFSPIWQSAKQGVPKTIPL